MSRPKQQPAKSKNFSAAFERMCNFVAISQTKNSQETLRELVLQCFVILPEDKFQHVNEIVNAIEALFGLQVATQDIEGAVDKLLADGLLTRPLGTNYVLDLNIKSSLEKRLHEANQLEDRVRITWFDELSVTSPHLPPETMWKALRNYLAKSFRRHGIQAIAYLDPTVESPEEYVNGLNTLLDKAVKETFGRSGYQNEADASNSISAFLASVGQHPDRVSYIAQLADGAFNYYSLTVDPEVAEQFRHNLQALTLFLDTNFLFGILDLHVNPFIDVSNQLMAAVEQHRLPFTLRYHVATEREFRSAIDFYGDRLRKRKWPTSLSRAASTTRNLSGIELKYHQKNAISPVDVEGFLNPYQHFDVLLKDRHIDIYRVAANHRLQEKADLLHEYTDFLNTRKKNKSDTLIDHDVTVLDAVQELRSNSNSTLAAGALLLTCDYLLYKFDWELSKRHNRRACVLLPNLFMQMLRPFIPASSDFDKSFAETFAIPEFRIIGSGASKASTRMLSLLAAYADFPEQTAVKMLSNDLLLEKLITIEDDAAFQEVVEAEIINQNNALLEENAELERQIEREREERLREQQEAQVRIKSTEAVAESEKHEKESALAVAERERQAKQLAIAETDKERTARESAEQVAKYEQAARASAEKRLETVMTVLSIVLSFAFSIGAYWLLDTAPPAFLINHKQRVPLLAFASLITFLVVLGALRPKWRLACWGGGLLSTVIGVIPLLGG